MKKADTAALATLLEEIPNIATAIADDLRVIGIERPSQLAGRDPYELYDELCRVTGIRHDPCVLDTFTAAVVFMEGGPRVPWGAFTKERKQALAAGEARGHPATPA